MFRFGRVLGLAALLVTVLVAVGHESGFIMIVDDNHASRKPSKEFPAHQVRSSLENPRKQSVYCEL